MHYMWKMFWCEETFYENLINFPTGMYYQNPKKASCCHILKVVLRNLACGPGWFYSKLMIYLETELIYSRKALKLILSTYFLQHITKTSHKISNIYYLIWLIY